MWIKNNFYKYSVGLILILLIIYLSGRVGFFWAPFEKFLAAVFLPLLVSGLLYYLFRPLVKFGERFKLPKSISILIVFLIFLIAFFSIGTYAGTLIGRQFNSLIHDLPHIMKTAKNEMTHLLNDKNVSAIFSGKLEQQLTAYLQNIVPTISGSIIGLFSTITSVAAALVMVPFIVYYLLKDDKHFFKMFLNIVPIRYKDEMGAIIRETDKTLSIYIIGQAIIALILGTMSYIGYLTIGLKYNFILSLFVMITSFIPMFGSIIGVIPAFFVGLSVNPLMGVKVLIVMIIVQQTEGNLVSPYIIGKRLAIHPLTIIFIFLGASALYGFVGMLVAVPVYAILKVIGAGAVRMYKIWKGGSLDADNS